MKNLNNKDEFYYMSWFCPQTGSREIAGVAYYNEESSDYRLIINFFPENNYFLKCSEVLDGVCHYKLLAVKQRGGASSRFFQGNGVLNRGKNEITIKVAPFSKLLIINLNGQPARNQKEIKA